MLDAPTKGREGPKSGFMISRQAIWRTLGAAGVIVAIALIVLPTSASPKGQVAKGQVTVSGGNRSAHVRISVVRDTLAITGGDVKGCEQSTRPGCRLGRSARSWSGWDPTPTRSRSSIRCRSAHRPPRGRIGQVHRQQRARPLLLGGLDS